MANDFGTLPRGATRKPTPFEIAIPEDDVAELKTLLKSSRVGPATPANTSGSHDLGVSREWLKNAKETWEKSYDWRKHEAHMNSFANYKVDIPLEKDGKEYTYNVHFAALFSKRQDATPIIAVHGWPGTFIEFLPILDLLKKKYTPDNLPYHIIVPSLPGYGFSSPPQTQELLVADLAKIFDKLMLGLGFDHYYAQGGDIGAFVGRLLVTNHDACKGAHFNMLIAQPADPDLSTLSKEEREGAERGMTFNNSGRGYSNEHGTRPNTIGFVLSSNPLALLAWIGEKWVEWSDDTPSMDTILTDISIYWFTNSISTSLYFYRELFTNVKGMLKPMSKPFGYTWYPKEIRPTPESWCKQAGSCVFFRQSNKGGHFAAVEQAEGLLKDVEDFIAQVTSKPDARL